MNNIKRIIMVTGLLLIASTLQAQYGVNSGSADYSQSTFADNIKNAGNIDVGGSATYSYTVKNVSLAYSSSNGWNVIGGGGITRSTKKGVPGYTVADTFELDGAKLIEVESETNYRIYVTELYEESKICYFNNDDPLNSYWTVTRSDGSISWYGQNSDLNDNNAGWGSKVFANKGAHEGKVRKWLIAETKTVDQVNTINYIYKRDINTAEHFLNCILTEKDGTDGRLLTVIKYNKKDEFLTISYLSGSRVEKSFYPYEITSYIETSDANAFNFDDSIMGPNHESGYFNVTDGCILEYDSDFKLDWRIAKIIPTGNYNPGENPPELNPIIFDYYDLNCEFDDESVPLGDLLANGTIRPYVKRSGVVADFMDMNGDGLFDRVYQGGSSRLDIQLGQQGNTFSNEARWEIPGLMNPTAFHGYAYNFLNKCLGVAGDYMDINGDGLPDRLRKIEKGSFLPPGGTGSSNPQLRVWFNNGEGFDPVSKSIPFADSWFDTMLLRQNAYIDPTRDHYIRGTYSDYIDMNGDGLLDRVTKSENQKLYVAINHNCEYFEKPVIWTLENDDATDLFYFQDYDYNHPLFVFSIMNVASFFDINGDGLPDRVIKESDDTTRLKVFLNNGNGFEDQVYWESIDDPLDGYALRENYNGHGIVDFMDMNNDGLIDRIQKKMGDRFFTVWLNTGSAFVKSDNISIYSNAAIYTRPISVEGDATGLLDIDGDGLPDRIFVHVEKWNDHLRMVRNMGGPAYKLKTIISPHGGYTSYTYKPLDKTYNPDCKPPLWVVSSVTKNDGLMNENITSYEYKKGVYDYKEKEFRGFGEVKKTMPSGDYTYYHYYTDDVKKGTLYWEQHWTKDGVVVFNKEITFSIVNVIDGRDDINMIVVDEELTTKSILLQPEQMTKVKYEYTYDTFPLVKTLSELVITSYGEVEKWEPYNDKGDDKSRTVITYLNNYDSWVFKLENEIWIYGFDSTGTISEIRSAAKNYYYPTFNLRETRKWDGSSWVNPVQYDYDEYGNIIKITDALNNTAQTFYDDVFHTFSVKTINPMGHITEIEYDNLMRVICTTEPNEIEHRVSYDEFGRVTETLIPGHVQRQLIHYTEAELEDNGAIVNPASTATEKYYGSEADEYLSQYSYFDGFGRIVQIKSRCNDVGGELRYETIDSYYGIVGNKTWEKTYVPDVTLSQFYTRPINPYDGIFTYSLSWLDGYLGEVSEKHDTDNKITRIEKGVNVHIVIDKNGNKTLTFKDGMDRKREVHKVINTTNTAVTKYNYLSGTNNLTEIIDDAGNTRESFYNIFGQIVTTIDPDMGTTGYAYDAGGNLTATLNNDKVIRHDYDELGRLVKTGYFDPDNNYDLFGYDTPVGGGYPLGHLTSTKVVRDGATVTSEHFRYNQGGLVDWHSKSINTGNGNKLRYMEYEYDMLGRMTLMRYPNDEEEVLYSYDDAGRLVKVNGSYYGWDFIQDIQYTPNGQINSLTYGNGFKDLYEYDNAFRVSVMETVDWNSDPLMSLGYSYDDVGNVTEIANFSYPDRSQIFTYDNLDRLMSASGIYGNNFYTYNNIGNIKSVNRDGMTFSYLYEDSAHVHAVTKNMEYGYDYDAAGNMTNKHYPGSTDIDYIYDWNNRLVEVIDNNGSNGSSTNPLEWALNAVYSFDDECTYENIIYKCITSHTAYAADWTPNRASSLWTELGPAASGNGSQIIFKADYDSRGNRVKTIAGDITTYYFFSGYEEEYGLNSECTEIKYYYALERKIAKCVNDGAPVFFHKDHLGSTSLISNNGYPDDPEVVYDMGYKPYGQLAYSSGSIEEPKYKYNDKEMDNSTGLYYYGARYYDPDLARFITADTVTPGGNFNPQGLNRYSYCYNNPMKYTDPSGNDPNDFQPMIDTPMGMFPITTPEQDLQNWNSGYAQMELAIYQTIGSGILSYVDPEPYSQRGLFAATLGGSINIINQLSTKPIEDFSYLNYLREYTTAGGFGSLSYGVSQLATAAIAQTVITGKWAILAAESVFALGIHYVKDTALYMGGYGKNLNDASTSAVGNAFVGTPLTIGYQLANKLSPTMCTIIQNSIGLVGNGWAILNGKYDITGKIRNAIRGGKDSSSSSNSDSGIGLHVSDHPLDTGSTFDFSFKLDYVFDDSDDFDDTTPAITSGGCYFKIP